MSVIELWLPILAAGIAVHIASTIAWIVLPHHKPEWPPLKTKDSLMDWLKGQGVDSGQYFVLSKEGEENENDPSAGGGTLILWENPPNMGANIGFTIATNLAISFLIGYLASMVLQPGAESLLVFRFTFVAAFLVHVMGGVMHVIWFRRKLLMDTLDGLAYAVITGAVYAALWPAAAV